VNRPIVPLIVATLLISNALPAWGQEKANTDEKEYARMPWHLVDVWWDIGKD
jgi:hypothetical protein